MTDPRHDTDPDAPVIDSAERREKDTLDIILDGFRGKRPAPAVEAARSRGRDSAFFEGGEARVLPEAYAPVVEDPVLIRAPTAPGPTFIIPRRKLGLRSVLLLAGLAVAMVLIWRWASSTTQSSTTESVRARGGEPAGSTSSTLPPRGTAATSAPQPSSLTSAVTTPSTSPYVSATVPPTSSHPTSPPSAASSAHAPSPRPPASVPPAAVSAPPESELLK